MATHISNYYLYQPNHVVPAVFAVLLGISLLLHIYQNFRFNFWRVTFFMSWGGLVFLVGWITRTVSSYHTDNLNLYIVQTVFIYAGPPIYSAAAYNIVGRLMNYLPMYAPLNPNRVLITFVYLGALVEALTAAGAAKMATADGDLSRIKNGGTIMAIALVLQAVVESLLVSLVALIHFRFFRNGSAIPANVKKLFITLYGTSTLVIVRCICRAIESFTLFGDIEKGAEYYGYILTHEWYIFAFEAAPMVLFTFWLNIFHTAHFLPRQKTRYLDLDGKTERLGPGWIDRRSTWETFADPFDLGGIFAGKPNHESFWLNPEKWPIARDGSFATGTASNTAGLHMKKSPDEGHLLSMTPA
ncbi:hypothetical protein PISL3812_04902 [Talaromyces islandicus]|uniref:Protein RTA1 n=1 Tax=Talaromyces islandicus TaxID=28573 RepID=A0A0U1LYU4_TALIS|nr:hypothetical protein PISL3812_04902 [Talaromyces islandicus]